MSDSNSTPAACVRCGAGSCVNLASQDRAHCPWNTDARTRAKMTASGSNTNPGTKGGTWGGILALVLVIGGCSAIFNSGDDGGSGDQSWDAERVCKDFVKDRLKAPSTADFDDIDSYSTGSGYVVTGAVDAENSFGAMLRSDFRCEIADGGDTWNLVSLTGLN